MYCYASLLLLLSLWCDKVTAHGFLKVPPARNVLALDSTPPEPCPHCLNGGTSKEVSNLGAWTWPKGRHGLCGDPWNDKAPRQHEAGGKFYTPGLYTTYDKGQVIDIEVLLTTNHNGRFKFRICKVSGGYDTAAENEQEQLTEECLDEHVLKQAKSGRSPGGLWSYAKSDDPVPAHYTISYQLPDNLTCDGVSSHCVLQWYWLTMNSCDPKGVDPKYKRLSATGAPLQECGSKGAPYPEEFWNCADILILDPSAGNNKKDSTASVVNDDYSIAGLVTEEYSTPSPKPVTLSVIPDKTSPESPSPESPSPESPSPESPSPIMLSIQNTSSDQ